MFLLPLVHGFRADGRQAGPPLLLADLLQLGIRLLETIWAVAMTTEGIITGQRMAEAPLKDMSYRHCLILDSVGEVSAVST